MSWIPGWDTIAGANWWSNAFFWAGIAALLFLGVSEVISHRYGERKDELVAQQQAAADRRHEQEMAGVQLETAQANERAANLEKETAVANARSAELKLALEREIAARQPRRISPEQHARLVSVLAQITNKGELSIAAKLFDEEAQAYEKQIFEALKEAGFNAQEIRGPFGFGVPGQWIVVRDLKKLQSEPSWVGAVQAALTDSLGLEFDGRQMDSTFKPEFGEVLIAIGAKP
jgi:hypothetical protein